MRRIRIGDDGPSVRDVVAMVLIDAGNSVQTAADGPIVLEIIDDAPPDLIVMDEMTPNFHGWALVDHARERHPTLPVILMSAGVWIPDNARYPFRITPYFSPSRLPSRSCWGSSCA